MRTKIRSLLMALLLVISLSGCDGSQDINDLALVMAVAIDPGSKPGTVLVTAQIARPADVVGQTGAPTAGTGSPTWTVQAEGSSIFEAIRNLSNVSTKRIYWAHNKIIVINEELLRTQGINDIVDFFSRNHELRMRTWVAATSERACDIITTHTGMQVIPGEAIESLFQHTKLSSEAPKMDMRTVQADLLGVTNEVVLPRVSLEDKAYTSTKPGDYKTSPQVVLSGAAYFDDDKMKGWISPKLTQGLMWFLYPSVSRVIAVPCVDSDQTGDVGNNNGSVNQVDSADNGSEGQSGADKTAALELKNPKFSIEPSFQGGQVRFQFTLRSNGDLVELGCPTEQPTTAVMKQLQQECDDKLRLEVEDIVQLAKQQHIDFLQLASRFQDKYPAEWIQMSPNWPDVFSAAKISVNVDVHLRSPVLLRTPTTPDTKHSYQAGTGK